MGFCEVIKTDQVICDEIFFFQHDETGVPIGIDVPEDSAISGTVLVSVLECNVEVPTDSTAPITADFLFMVQKELQITTLDGDVIPLEFLERIPFHATFRKCSADLPEGITPAQLRCQILRTSGTDTISLNTADDTFSEELTIEVKLKIVAETQEFLALCPPNNQVDIQVTPAP